MKKSKHAFTFALAGLFISYGAIAHAETATAATSSVPVDPFSYIPLALFALSAIVVYLCNRPRRVVTYARARRRTESSRD